MLVEKRGSLFGGPWVGGNFPLGRSKQHISRHRVAERGNDTLDDRFARPPSRARLPATLLVMGSALSPFLYSALSSPLNNLLGFSVS